jgi:hypothetical protein
MKEPSLREEDVEDFKEEAEVEDVNLTINLT